MDHLDNHSTVGWFLVLLGHILYYTGCGWNVITVILASFPGPAQVSGICSGECLETIYIYNIYVLVYTARIVQVE